jgi:DtxR family Mn-dependent transcriptional regulator
MPHPVFLLSLAIVIIFISLLLLWPRKGFFARIKAFRRFSNRVLREDALKHIQKLEYLGQHATIRSLAGSLGVDIDKAAEVIDDLEKRQLVCIGDGEWCLTTEGREVALQVIRAHRLWERFLLEETGYSEEEWHHQAEEHEHNLTVEEIDALARSLGYPSHDPHGDPIPTAEGHLPREEGISLTKLDPNKPARIIHIPDEPDMVAAQIQAEGLVPGMVVRIADASPLRIRFWVNGDEHVLAPLVANNIVVVPLLEEHKPAPSGEPLWMLKPGQLGEVLMLSPRCRGPERRRLMDLGVLPGTLVEAELISPSGDPTAYRIRDALIALRREQAEWIRIKPVAKEV